MPIINIVLRSVKFSTHFHTANQRAVFKTLRLLCLKCLLWSKESERSVFYSFLESFAGLLVKKYLRGQFETLGASSLQYLQPFHGVKTFWVGVDVLFIVLSVLVRGAFDFTESRRWR